MAQKVHRIDNIAGFLKVLNLDEYQLHPSFHILKSEGHLDRVSKQAVLHSNHCFQVSYATSFHIGNSKMKVQQTLLDPLRNRFSFAAPGNEIRLNDTRSKLAGVEYTLVFTPDFWDDAASDYTLIRYFPFFNLKVTHSYATDTKDSAQFLQLLEIIYHKFTLNEPIQFELLRQYFRIFLLEIKRLVLGYDNGNFTEPGAVTHALENLIKQYENKHQKISFYADQLKVKPKYLSECVKKSTGLTIKQLVSKYAILEASSLLQFTTLRVGEIAAQLGFSDRSNFINFFREKTRYTPTQFRAIFSSPINSLKTYTDLWYKSLATWYWIEIFRS